MTTDRASFTRQWSVAALAPKVSRATLAPMRMSVVLLFGLLALSCGSSGSAAGGAGGTTGGNGGSATGGSGGTLTGGSGGSGTGGASGASTGGASTGGSSTDGGVPTVSCTADAGASPTPDPATRGGVSASDGTFVDECDAQGNLVEYGCETEQLCTDPPNPSCTSYETGKSSTQSFDCDGKCKEGRCEARCPEHGDQVVSKGTDASGKYVFDSAADDRDYACTLIFSGSGCVPGQGGVIDGLGLQTSFCTGGTFGNIQVAGCSYNCSFSY